VGRLRRALARPRAGTKTVAAVGALVLGGCGLVGGPKTIPADVPNTITVTSPDFVQGIIPRLSTCHGAGQSPVIHWSGAPQGTKSLALVVDDSAAPITPYVYWIVFDIGPQSSGIPAGGLPTGARQADNSHGTAHYDPPCPTNSDHGYRFTVYALSRWLRLPNGTSLKTAWTAIAQAAIRRGRLPATAKP
jgi:hypothetical protein